MPTPNATEYVEWVGSLTTLLFGSDAIRCRNFEGLRSVGDSRGRNLRVGGAAGTLERARVRDELAVDLSGIVINGRYTEENVKYVGDSIDNALTLRAKVADWPDTESRSFTVRLTDGTGVYEAAATFEQWGEWQRPAPDIYQTSALITIAAGTLTVVP